MAAANPRCTAKGKPCEGPICGHCPRCGNPWDNHAGLSLDISLADLVKCPKVP